MEPVKLTLGQIVSSVQVLSVIASTKLPVKTSYNLNKMLRKVSKEAEIYEEERVKILERFMEDDEEGKRVIPKDKREEAQQAVMDLLGQEVDIVLPELTLDMLETVDISPLDLQVIEPLLNLKEDDEPPV